MTDAIPTWLTTPAASLPIDCNWGARKQPTLAEPPRGFNDRGFNDGGSDDRGIQRLALVALNATGSTSRPSIDGRPYRDAPLEELPLYLTDSRLVEVKDRCREGGLRVPTFRSVAQRIG